MGQSAAAVDGGRSIQLTFDFEGTRGYTGVGEVQVTMFNCPDWGLAVQSIRLQNSGGESVLSSRQLLYFSGDSYAVFTVSVYILRKSYVVRPST